MTSTPDDARRLADPGDTSDLLTATVWRVSDLVMEAVGLCYWAAMVLFFVKSLG